jgi:hypothetical protein
MMVNFDVACQPQAAPVGHEPMAAKMKSAALCGAFSDFHSPNRPEGPRGRTREKEKLHL